MSSLVVQGLFVTGTDTGVGKTLVSAAIVRLLREHGFNTVGFKPVATGVVNGQWGDAVALYEASGGCESLEKICPMRFDLPLAPTLSAQAQGLVSDIAVARKALLQLFVRHDSVIVEGVGGLLVPLDAQTLVADFAAQIGFPVLLVCRAGLGTINHTLLTLRELERMGLDCAGIIMNVTRRQDEAMVQGAKAEIERVSGKKILAVLPYMGTDRLNEDVTEAASEAPLTALVERAARAFSSQINVSALLGSTSLAQTGLKKVKKEGE